MAPLLRFAPSPTGPLHLGGLRTALINHLFSRKHGGKWILRVEDTDAVRTVPGALEGIRLGLDWAGLDYDYGPHKPGPHGPYFQSERLDLYHKHTKKLLEDGHAYRCFCSPTRLAETRERLARTGSNSTYDKACLALTEEESVRRARAGESFIVRMDDSNIPNRLHADDMIFGKIHDHHGSIATDPVLLKSDKFPTYHLANVVDDHEMGITHVIRGEEWLASLPLHLDLYAMLKLEPPKFAHLPMLLNPDGSKMSKRKGDVRVEDYIREGWEPVAVLNWLALVGWGVGPEHVHEAPDSTAVLTREEMLEQFDITVFTHRRNTLDPFKLEVVNKGHLARQPISELATRAKTLVETAFPKSELTGLEYLESVLKVMLPRLSTLKELPLQAPYFFVDPSAPSRTMMTSHTTEHVLDVVRSTLKALDAISPDVWSRDNLAAVLKEVHVQDDQGKLFMSAVRIAISGMKSGPPIPDMMAVMGKPRTMHILSRVEQSLSEANPLA